MTAGKDEQTKRVNLELQIDGEWAVSVGKIQAPFQLNWVIDERHKSNKINY